MPDEPRITRHAAVDRALHWITAASTLALLASGFLPIAGLKFSWVPLHWISGVILTLAVLVHVLRSTFFRRLRCMLIRARDLRDALQGRKAAKYTLAQKGMHVLLGGAVLIATITGVLMLARIDTPFWQRNPYLLQADTWGIVYVLHGAAALVSLTLTMVHIYFSLLPEKRGYLRAMIGGSMARPEAAAYHDPQRWAGNRKNDPKDAAT